MNNRELFSKHLIDFFIKDHSATNPYDAKIRMVETFINFMNHIDKWMLENKIYEEKHIKFETSKYTPTFNNDYVLRFMTRGGIVDGIGEDVRVQNNFYLGANDIRGFFIIGPRDLNNSNQSNATGGKIFYIGSAEFRFPLGLPRELGVNGALFCDNGVLKSVDSSIKKNAQISPSNKLRSSVGFSISWASPMGPIRFDFAKIIRKEKHDKTQFFNFNIGTSFF
jgi:outer membrane protein insertion porin family